MKTLTQQHIDWENVTGRELTKFERMMIARPFRQSSEGLWSRVIKPCLGGKPVGQIEIPFGEIIKFSVRESVIPLGPYVKVVDKILSPEDAFHYNISEGHHHEITSAFGYELAKELMYGDVLSYLDLRILQELRTQHPTVKLVHFDAITGHPYL